ncbi:MAG: hypothetical protein Q9221_003085 [Calogaya cf. arnoldii]
MAAARLGFDLGNTELLVQAATEHQGLYLEGPGPSSKGKSKAQRQVEEYNVTDQATSWKEIMALQKGQYGGTDPLLIVRSSPMKRLHLPLANTSAPESDEHISPRGNSYTTPWRGAKDLLKLYERAIEDSN